MSRRATPVEEVLRYLGIEDRDVLSAPPAAEALAEYPEPSHPYLPWNIACIFALSGAKLQAAGFVEMTLRLDPGLEDQLLEDPELEGVDIGAIARMGRRRSS